jgi:hypothetical protein
MAEIPHFDYPFRYVKGAPVVNEQESTADIVACITAICNTEPETLYDLPAFGLPDPTFAQEPLDPKRLLGPIARWEPRAPLLAEVNPTAFDAAVVNANIEVGT